MDTKTNRRRKLTLDLNAASQSMAKKKVRDHEIQGNNCILTSPDVQMLKLTSPQMREFITKNATLETPTPGFEFPKTVTEQQTLYVKGFEDALEGLKAKEVSTLSNDNEINHRSTRQNKLMADGLKNLPPLPPLIQAPQGSLIVREDLGDSEAIGETFLKTNISIKKEKDDLMEGTFRSTSAGSRSRRKTSTSSNDDSVSSFGYDSQDMTKLERKRQRNRVAASKCRKRKLERIALLDTRVSELRGENNTLAVMVKNLKETVYKLKQEVLDHVKTGCRINMVEESAAFSN